LRNFEECDEARAAGCQCVPLRTSFFGACSLPSVPEPVFSCTGSRMRLRLINGSGNMPLRFQIEETQMLLIAQDGCDLDLSGNRLVDTLLLPVGQRVDVLVQCKPANSRPLKMLVTVAQAFVPPQACVLNISTWGVMVSSGSHDNNVATATSVESMVFNDLDVDQQLKIFNRPPVELKVAPAAKERIVLVSIGAWDEGELGSELEYWLINGKSWTMPREPLLQYWKRNGQTMPLNDDVFGPIVVPLQLGSVYEVVMINLSMQQHPWHLHGYHVDIVDVGFIRGGDYAEDFNYSAVEKFPRDVAAPVMTRADSWLVPQYGFVVFRSSFADLGKKLLKKKKKKKTKVHS
jgi:L-ascorbate oxidase